MWEVFHLRGFGGLGPVTDHPLWAQEATAGLEAPGDTARPLYHLRLSGCRRQFAWQDEARRFGLEVSEQGQVVIEA